MSLYYCHECQRTCDNVDNFLSSDGLLCQECADNLEERDGIDQYKAHKELGLDGVYGY